MSLFDLVNEALSKSSPIPEGYVPENLHFIILADTIRYSKDKREFFFEGEKIGELPGLKPILEDFRKPVT